MSKATLAQVVLTNYGFPGFYRADPFAQVEDLCRKVPTSFVQQLALYARYKANMRTASHKLAAILADDPNCPRSFFAELVKRPDDITGILGAYKGDKLPGRLRKGLRTAFNKFRGPALLKYKKGSKGYKLRDAVNLLHPRPVEGNRKALSDLMRGKPRADTWESRRSKGMSWQECLPVMGPMAKLKNLVKMEEAGITLGVLDLWDTQIHPYRYYQTYLMSTKHRMVLEDCMSRCTLPDLPGKTAVFCDMSYSMNALLSDKGVVKRYNIAQLFTAMLRHQADLFSFSDDCFRVYPETSILATAESFGKPRGGTDMGLCFDTLTEKYDRIIFIGDGEDTSGRVNQAFREYVERVGHQPTVWLWDVSGVGNIEVKEPFRHIAGFSENVFDLLALLETKHDALVQDIEKFNRAAQ